jgi:DNA-binding MarR family transcriptional regulator
MAIFFDEPASDQSTLTVKRSWAILNNGQEMKTMRNIEANELPNTAIRVFNLFYEIAHSAVREADRLLYKAAGLSAGKFSVLMVLSSDGGTVTASKLAGRTNTRPHNITTLVDRMKKDGLVATERSQIDRRSVDVILTEKGRSVLTQALPTAREVVARFTASMSKQELVAAEKLLNKVKRNFNKNIK